MRVLVGCERSGVVAQAFRDAGHDAWSADLVPSALCLNTAHTHGEGDCCGHYIGDVLDILQAGAWDLLIAHPPCTYLASSGLHWNHRIPGRAEKTEAAAEFALRLWDSRVPRIALENPVGRLTRYLGRPAQIIHPYMFGHDASKQTCLWLRGLPLLELPQDETWIAPRYINGLPRWGNQTDSGQNRLGPSPTRAMDRAKTYPGIARAMAAQWGTLSPQP